MVLKTVDRVLLTWAVTILYETCRVSCQRNFQQACWKSAPNQASNRPWPRRQERLNMRFYTLWYWAVAAFNIILQK